MTAELHVDDRTFPPQVIKDWIAGKSVFSDRLRAAFEFWMSDEAWRSPEKDEETR